MPPLPLAGQTIALAEGRQLEDLARLLDNEGATILRCPLLSILDAPDSAPVTTWLRDLVNGTFGLVVLMTGEALRRLIALAEREGTASAVVAALAKVQTLTRGPKPANALKEIGLVPSATAKSPTTAGVIATLKERDLKGVTVGYTLSGVPNPVLEQFLVEAGALPRAVLPYVYGPASDGQRVGELITALARGEVRVLVFTSAPQVDRLFEVAHERQLEQQLGQGLRRVRIAAVGPIVAENLQAKGFLAQICPEQGWVMKNLVQHIKRDVAGRSE